MIVAETMMKSSGNTTYDNSVSSIGSRRGRLLDVCFFFFQAEDGIRDLTVTGVQTCALPIWNLAHIRPDRTVDPAFAPNPNSDVLALAVSGSTVYAGGDFGAIGGKARNRVGDRKSVVEGKRVDLGGRRIIKKKK